MPLIWSLLLIIFFGKFDVIAKKVCDSHEWYQNNRFRVINHSVRRQMTTSNEDVCHLWHRLCLRFQSDATHQTFMYSEAISDKRKTQKRTSNAHDTHFIKKRSKYSVCVCRMSILHAMPSLQSVIGRYSPMQQLNSNSSSR